MKLKLETFPPGHDSLLEVSHHDNENPCNFLWHYHSRCELVYVPFGSGRRQVGHHFSRFSNGDLVLIGPNVPHLNFNYEAQQEYEEVVIQFEKEKLLSALALIPEFFKLSIWLKSLQSAMAFGTETRRILDQDIRNLLILPPAERVLSFLKILYALSADKERVILDAPEKGIEYKAHEAERVNRIYAYVKSHYQSVIDMEEVVELSGL